MKTSHLGGIMNIRKGCKDVWNAFMVHGAAYSPNDIPYCPTTALSLPNSLISYEEAKTIHRNAMHNGHTDYYVNAFIHFWIDDQKFDGNRKGIWSNSQEALEIIKHFAGIITPDFSTNVDFPEPIKVYNTYRMRAFGFWIASQGISVINNVRWGTEETWRYCWDGIPQNSIVAIGTVASGLRQVENRPVFETGIREMVRRLHPHTIIVYGSANYPVFDELRSLGVYIKAFPSRMDTVFSGRCGHE